MDGRSSRKAFRTVVAPSVLRTRCSRPMCLNRALLPTSHRRHDMGTKVALVTAASSGIGLRIANTLLDRGYRVVAASRTASRHAAVADATRFIAVDGDVGDEETA